MKSRERVRKAINFDYPDRPPISHAILPSAQLYYGEKLDAVLKDVHEDFGWEKLPDMLPEEYPPYYRKGEHFDGFGTLWSCAEDGEYGVPKQVPLRHWADYEAYQWPDFEITPVKKHLYSGHMDGPSGDYYARGGWITFFE